MKILECNDPYVCRNYHSITRSVCCDAKITGRMMYEMNKKRRNLSQEEFKERLTSENEKGNWAHVPGVIFRDFCDECGNECDYESRHR